MPMTKTTDEDRMTKPDVQIWTDGACKGNPGVGGWGALLQYGQHEKEIYGGDPETTNNRMELQAVIEALNLLNRPCKVLLYTDSQYVKRGKIGRASCRERVQI